MWGYDCDTVCKNFADCEAEEFDISAPWYTYQRKLAHFFEYDDGVTVSPLKQDGDEGNWLLPISVTDTAKAFALKTILKPSINFGAVTVTVVISCGQVPNLARAAFSGNAVVREIATRAMPGGMVQFVQLEPEVIQFFNDDISHPEGLTTILAEGIARDIFDPTKGFTICTVDMRENQEDA